MISTLHDFVTREIAAKMSMKTKNAKLISRENNLVYSKLKNKTKVKCMTIYHYPIYDMHLGIVIDALISRLLATFFTL